MDLSLDTPHSPLSDVLQEVTEKTEMDFLGRTSFPLFAPVEKCRMMRNVLVEEGNQCSVSREESRVSRGEDHSTLFFSTLVKLQKDDLSADK